MRIAISLFAVLLFVTGCPGTASTGGRRVPGDNDNQNNGDVTEPNENTNDPTEPDDNGDLPDIPDDLPAEADFFLALFSGPPPDGVVEASLGSDDVDIRSFQVDADGVYTIELNILTSDAGAVEAKGTAIGTAVITPLSENLPIVPDATNLTIDVTALIAILDPQSPRFTLVVVFGAE